jgi:hypothetical protein
LILLRYEERRTTMQRKFGAQGRRQTISSFQ